MSTAFTIPTTAAPVDSAFTMKIKTGIKSGNAINSAQQAVAAAGEQVSGFVNTANAQAGSLVNQAASAWNSLIGMLR